MNFLRLRFKFLSISLFFLSGVWRRSVCLPGSGPPARRGAARQTSEDAKFYRARRVGYHLHADKDRGVSTLARGETEGQDHQEREALRDSPLNFTNSFPTQALWQIIHRQSLGFQRGKEWHKPPLILELMKNIRCLYTTNVVPWRILHSCSSSILS